MRRASYQYDPYGNITSMEGDMAEENPFRFSSEHHDEDLGLVYYNYRHYNPTDGRWISRDPIAEQGGWNLYAFVANRPTEYFDKFGTFLGGAITGALFDFGLQVIDNYRNDRPLFQIDWESVVISTAIGCVNPFGKVPKGFYKKIFKKHFENSKITAKATQRYISATTQTSKISKSIQREAIKQIHKHEIKS